MQNEVSTEFQGVLEVRRHEGVVDAEQSTGSLGQSGSGLNVGHLQGRVGRGLDPNELGVGVFLERPLELTGLGSVDKSEGNAVARGSNATEVSLGTTVHIVDADHVVTLLQQMQNGHSGSQTGSKGKTVLAEFSRSDGTLKRSTSGVVGTRVLQRKENFHQYLCQKNAGKYKRNTHFETFAVGENAVLARGNTRRNLGVGSSQTNRGGYSSSNRVGLLKKRAKEKK